MVPLGVKGRRKSGANLIRGLLIRSDNDEDAWGIEMEGEEGSRNKGRAGAQTKKASSLSPRMSIVPCQEV